jgi:type II secretory pathway pseudopilin PulG
MNRPERPRSSGVADDTGITLMEVLMSMALMSVVMTMFTTAITQLFRAANKAESTIVAQQQLNNAFARLDREIRYAAGISVPKAVADPAAEDQVVEYLTTTSGTPTCTQLRLAASTALLQSRTWDEAGDPPAQWTTLVSQVTSGTVAFVRTEASATFNYQQLTVGITASHGSGADRATKHAKVTFTALNTSLTTSSDTVCGEGR